MTNTERMLLEQTLKRSCQVSEYRVNSLGEERSTHYKISKKKLIEYVEQEHLRVKLVNDYPAELGHNMCYVQYSGKMVWIRSTVID